jgi:hypothetical protein
VADEAAPWVPINGTERVIVGDLTLLADGVPVEVAPVTGGTKLVSTSVTATETDSSTKGRPTNSPPGPGPVEASNAPVGTGKDEF